MVVGKPVAADHRDRSPPTTVTRRAMVSGPLGIGGSKFSYQLFGCQLGFRIAGTKTATLDLGQQQLKAGVPQIIACKGKVA